MITHKGVCTQHSGVNARLDDLERTFYDHEERLRKANDSFRATEAAIEAIRGDIKVIRILLGLAILASFLGGAVGPEIWRALGLGG
jgi:hypothetical protein